MVRSNFDLSSIDLDGNHTSGTNVEYQGRKKHKTINALYLTDRQGFPLAMSEPMSGNHNGLYEIEVQFYNCNTTLEDASIPIKGLFLNAATRFDSKDFRKCYDSKEINAIYVLTNIMEIQIEINILTKNSMT